MGASGGGSDRRQQPRGAVVATATVVATGRWMGLYACENLSVSGALLAGPQRLCRGDAVRLKLHLPERGPVEVEARVVRTHATPQAQTQYALKFHDVSAEIEDAIQNAVVEALERQMGRGRTRALVVHETELTRRAFVRDLKALDIEAVCAASAQEAADWLEDPDQTFAFVIVDGHMEPEQKVALLEGLQENHPQAQRLLVSGLRHASLPHLALASGHAHAVVTQPWNLRALAVALGREEQSADLLKAMPCT